MVIKLLLVVCVFGSTSGLSLKWPFYGRKCDSSIEFECTDSSAWTIICIPINLKCNGVPECKDGSDETGCVAEVRPEPEPSVRCPSGQFLCDHDRCYPVQWRCDGIADCYDDVDEVNCRAPTTTTSTTTTTTTTTPAPTPAPRCNKGDFMCRNQERCFPLEWRCDGIIDCNDGSDEHQCTDRRTTKLTTRAPTPAPFSCPAMMSPCDSRDKCIFDWFRCDRILDCPDGSDERNCPGRNQRFPFIDFINAIKLNGRR